MIKESVTVIRSQYNGTNPRHFWISFLLHHEEIPLCIGTDSNEEKEWLSSPKSNGFIFGLGNTPGAAVRAMYKKKRESSAN